MAIRIMFISKYPPLQGGIASRTYWLARGLAGMGNHVCVVSHNPSAASEYVGTAAGTSAESPSLRVYTNSDDVPWHIPNDPERSLSLLDLAIQVADTDTIDVVDSGYLVPYGIVGHLLKRSRSIPHVLRHGGSDLAKFLSPGRLPALLGDVLASADVVVTDAVHSELIRTWRPDARVQPSYVPSDEFNPRRTDADRPLRVAYVGKANFHWEFKQLGRVGAIMGALHHDITTTFMAQGNGLESLRQALIQDNVTCVEWSTFQHPALMPDFFAQTDAIFEMERSLPSPVFSNVVAEALCAGVGVVTDRMDLATTYADMVIPDHEQILALPSNCSAQEAARRVEEWLRARGAGWRFSPQRRVAFDTYLRRNEQLYGEVLDR